MRVPRGIPAVAAAAACLLFGTVGPTSAAPAQPDPLKARDELRALRTWCRGEAERRTRGVFSSPNSGLDVLLHAAKTNQSNLAAISELYREFFAKRLAIIDRFPTLTAVRSRLELGGLEVMRRFTKQKGYVAATVEALTGAMAAGGDKKLLATLARQNNEAYAKAGEVSRELKQILEADEVPLNDAEAQLATLAEKGPGWKPPLPPLKPYQLPADSDFTDVKVKGPLGRPVPPPVVQVDDPGWLAQQREAILAAAVERTEWVRSLRDCIQSGKPLGQSLGGADLKGLQPGDVLVVEPQGVVSKLVGTADLFYTGRVNQPPEERGPVVSHCLTFIGRDASGKALFLDHTSKPLLGLGGAGGSRLMSETEYLQEYGTRQQYVASPLLPRQGRELMKYAMEAAKKTSEGRLAGSDYGIFGKNDQVCSERSRIAIGKATGLDVPKLHGGPIDLTPSDFFDKQYEGTEKGKYWVITPLGGKPSGQ